MMYKPASLVDQTKNPPAMEWDMDWVPLGQKMLWREEMESIPVFLPENAMDRGVS